MMRPMSSESGQSRHIFGWIFGILLLGAVAGLIWMGVRAGWRSNEATLPDGSTVEFLGTAAGEGTFKTASKWQRLARRYLPARLQNLVPSAVSGGGCWSGSNSLTVYLRILGTNRTIGGGPAWQGYVSEDGTGFRYPSDGGYCSYSDRKGQRIYGLNMRAHPRRQQEFLFHLLAQNKAAIATFRVPNPLKGPFPVWQPAALPQTRTNGPVILTLMDWTENATWHYPEPKWRLESVDPAWLNAQPRNRGFEDVTGNEGQFLSPRETAWKFRALVFRERVEDFAAPEQMVLTNLALPDDGKFLAIDKSADGSGVAIKPWILAGAGTFGMSNDVTRFMKAQVNSGHSISSGSFGKVEEWGSATPFLLVEARNVQTDDEIQFRVREDTGKELKVKASGYDGLPGGGRLYKPSFTPSDECESVTVRIIVNRPLPFEFMVSPVETGKR